MKEDCIGHKKGRNPRFISEFPAIVGLQKTMLDYFVVEAPGVEPANDAHFQGVPSGAGHIRDTSLLVISFRPGVGQYYP